MGSCKDKLRTARINLKGGTEEQRRNALEELREICSEYSGTPCAQEAHELLEKYDSSSSTDDAKSSSLDELERRWASLRGIRDARFHDYFQAIREQDLVRPMKETVIRSLRNWLNDELARLREDRRLEDVEAAADVLRTIKTVEAYAIELVDVRERLREIVFEIRFEALRRDVERALDEWKVQEAWRRWDDILEQGFVPDSIQESVYDLKGRIEEVDEVRDSVETRLDELEDARVQSWADADHVLHTVQFFQGLDASLPESKEQTVERIIDEKLARLNEFVVQSAEEADSLEEISEFWQSYRRTGLLAAEPVETDAVTAESRSTMEAIVHHRLKDAEAPADIEAMETDLNTLCSNPPLSQRLTAFADTLREEVHAIGQQWRAMYDGRRFHVPDGSFPLPLAFDEQVEEYEQYLADVDEFPFRTEEGPVPEDTLRRAITVADTILDEVQDHQEALALKREAEERLHHRELDASLAEWRVTDFRKHASQKGAPERYRRLLEDHVDTLREMARLQAEDEFTGWNEAMEWSEHWKAACEAVTAGHSIPDALDAAIEDETERREAQWVRVLDRLREQDAVPIEELTTLHERLADLLDVFEGLESDRKLLHREILVRRMRTALEEEEVEEAQNYVEELEERFDGPPQELAVRLDVEQARKEGPKALAELLEEKWGRVCGAYGEEAFETLAYTLVQNWQANNDTVIRDCLQPVLRRIREENMPPELVRWKTWLDLERGLRKEVSQAKLRRLEEYAQDPPREDIRDRQLKHLVQQWREDDNWRALSWTYRAFEEHRALLFPEGEDPIAQLQRQSREEAASIREDLVAQIRAGEHDVAECKKRLNEELDRWRDLRDLYEWSSHDTPQRPDELEEVKRLLRGEEQFESLQNDFVYEWDGDLHWRLFENVRYNVVGSINESEVKEYLLGRHDALRSLAEDVRHLKEDGQDFETKVKEAAQFCGRTDERSVRQEHNPTEEGVTPFRLLARHLEGVRQRFDDVSAEWSEILTLPNGLSVPNELAQQFRERIEEWAGIRSWPSLSHEWENGSWDRLIAQVQALDEQEERFRNKIKTIRQHPVHESMPKGGTFDPHKHEEHQEFLELLPDEGPRSKRVFRLFELFVTLQPMPTVLGQCTVADVPDWIHESGLTDANNRRK